MPEKLAKRFIAISLILVAVSLAVGVYFVKQTFDNIFNNINTEVGQSARAVAFEQQSWVQRNHQLADVLSVLPEVVGNDMTKCSKVLSDILKAYPQYTNFGVVDLNGNVICSGLPYTSKINFSNESWFKNAISNNNFSIGDFQIGPISKKPIIIFGHPIYDSSLTSGGKIKRVISIGLDLNWIHDLLSNIDMKQGEVAFVIDRNGIILAGFPDQYNSVGKNFTGGAFLDQVINNGAHTFNIIGSDGVRRIYASTPLSGEGENDLYFIFGVPVTSIITQTTKVSIPFIIIFMIGIFILRDVFHHHRKEAIIKEETKEEPKEEPKEEKLS